MNNRSFFIFYGALILVGMVAVVYFGIQPKTLPIIKFSQFENSKIVSDAILERTKEHIEDSKLVFWGIDPEESFQNEALVNAVVQIQSSNFKFDAIVIDEPVYREYATQTSNLNTRSNQQGLKILEQLQNDFKSSDHFKLNEEIERFKAGLANVKANNLRLLVVTTPIEATRRNEQSLINKLFVNSEKNKEFTYSSYIFSSFPRSHDDEEFLKIPCQTSEESVTNLSLGCLILQKARMSYRKKIIPEKWVGLMEQISTNEILTLVTKDKQN